MYLYCGKFIQNTMYQLLSQWTKYSIEDTTKTFGLLFLWDTHGVDYG